MSDQLDVFIEDILNRKQLTGVTDEVRQQVASDLKERLLDQIQRALIDAMSDEKLAEFNQLLESGDLSGADVQNFIAQSGVDTRAVTVQTMLTFSSLYLKGAQRAE